ncbi:hypothetical protein MBUL_02673 [Methylobacterium bullatum]|uniref:Gamma-glutamylcyclotransferase AIG2-like domain-containing protein n=1 Tax=Methylobacterium bullatum TaxID=570505 RepID=A0A679IUX3_9HYPH|nr:hypothetical protein MBUL_02673 [Methylobacterium bullatum]
MGIVSPRRSARFTVPGQGTGGGAFDNTHPVTQPMPLYFSYGANMDAAAMAARCPGSTSLGTARLNRHRFIIMREGYASVVRAPASTVWGVLWDLALADVPALDRYEGVAGRLYTKAYQPVTTSTGVKRALIYLGCSAVPGAPRPDYLQPVLAAAEAASLPPAYIAEMRRWLRASRN